MILGIVELALVALLGLSGLAYYFLVIRKKIR